MDIKITKLTIQIGDKEIELTSEEAKALKYQLDNLLGANVWTYPIYPTYPTYPVVTYGDSISCSDSFARFGDAVKVAVTGD